MQKNACCMHPCRSAGCRQARPGPRSVPCEHNMRARGMACCMNVSNNIPCHEKKSACISTHAVHMCTCTFRAGCCQAGLGPGTVSLALNMRVRGMACCMRIEIGIQNVACMPNSRHGSYQGSAPRLPRTAKIDGSRNAMRRALPHCMAHGHESICT